MSLYAAFYTFFIGPIQLMLETIFWFSGKFFANPGFSIAVLSLMVNLLTLPLYVRADAVQERVRQKQRRLRPMAAHIRKTFRGDERYMMLSTCYRQNHYSPWDSLKGAVSLLLQIPFFMAAYAFLSDLELLQGVPFGPIPDLGKPDGMLVLSGFRMNLLPLAMTGINLLSCLVYSRDLTARDRIQLCIMAAVFLLLLYDSPGGLVLYWTFNNLFSLVKNLWHQVKNKKRAGKIASGFLAGAGACWLFYVLQVHPMASAVRQMAAAAAAVVLMLPLLFSLCPPVQWKKISVKPDKKLFFGCAAVLALLTGVLIPSSVLRASPEEFINVLSPHSPLAYVLSGALLAAGAFLLWGGIFYSLAAPSGKSLLTAAFWLFMWFALINYMVFTRDGGRLSSELQIISGSGYGKWGVLGNTAMLLLLGGLLLLLLKKAKHFQMAAVLSLALVMTIMSLGNLFSAAGVLRHSEILRNGQSRTEEQDLRLPLSKNGKNVVVIMLDRAINAYVPYMMQEKPELMAQFSGFTYYPNTISYGVSTLFGAPALYGGYEYTPLEINRREDIPLVTKHNEALRVMPVNFAQEKYAVTVVDPSYAGYQEIPDLSIYGDQQGIHACLAAGFYYQDSQAMGEKLEHIRMRNFFCYSLSRTAPLLLRNPLYSSGFYCDVNNGLCQNYEGVQKCYGLSGPFLQNYEILKDFRKLTRLQETDENQFLMIASMVPHAPAMLQTPEYVPGTYVDNRSYMAAHAEDYVIDGQRLKMETVDQVTHYHANMAAFLALGRWFDFLRANDVYDNTRIILVSDHGYGLNQLDAMKMGDTKKDILPFHCLLMVKDFEDRNFTTDLRFMTNAEVPALAFEGLIPSPVNPATGKPITGNDRPAGRQYVFSSRHWSPGENPGTQFAPGEWYSVQDNIFVPENWQQAAEPES